MVKSIIKFSNNLLGKIDKSSLLLIYLFAFLCILIKNIFFSSYQYSLGSDELIVITIPAFAISNAENITDYINAITYSLFFEDHLNITTNILSPLMNSLIDKNSIQVPSGLLYFISLFLFYFLAKIISSKEVAIFSIFLIASNWAASWYLASSNVTFTLSLIFQISTIIIALKCNQKSSIYSLLTLFVICVLGSFTFENYFLCYFIIASFMITNNVSKLKTLFNDILKLFNQKYKIILTLIFGLFPYFTLHYLKFGSILPQSRLTGEYNLFISSIFKTVAKVINDLLFGLPENIIIIDNIFNVKFLLLFVILSAGCYWLKKISYKHKKYEKNLAISVIVSVAIVGATGRYHPGMWAICWMLFALYLSSIIIHVIQKKRNQKIYVLYLIPIITFFVSTINTELSPRVTKLNDYNHRSYLLDETFHKISPSITKNSLFVDLTDDKIFHEIRVLLNERSKTGFAPADVEQFEYGAQPIGSSINFVSSKFDGKTIKKSFTLNILHKKKIIYILNTHILIYGNYDTNEKWKLYKWDNCNNKKIDLIEKNKLLSLGNYLDIEEDEILAEYLKSNCDISEKYQNAANSEETSSLKVKIINPKYHCRLEIKELNTNQFYLNFIKKNHTTELDYPSSYPVSIISTSLHSDLNKRFSRDIIATNKNNFMNLSNEFCNIDY